MVTAVKEVVVKLRRPHEKQEEFIGNKLKRKIIRAGRRSGKTVGVAILALQRFLAGARVLYSAPTGEQTDRFWYEVNRALASLVDTGLYKRNETEQYIEKLGTENRIKAKTAWNANTLRGDYADLLILDEWQLMAEDTWEDVGAPMLLDNNGDAVFIYTPPSLKSSGVSRARDPRHASKMFRMAQSDNMGRWAAFHFTSHDNPFLSSEGLLEITQDMSRESYLKEIMAEDDESQVNLLVYSAFNELICKKDRFEIPRNWLIYSGHDFGSANPAALFLAETPGSGDFFCFKEYVPRVGRSTYQNVQAFMELMVGYNVVRRAGGSHQEEEIRQGYGVQGWPIEEPYIPKPVQVDRVKGLMEKNKIYIFSDMYQLLEQINSCMWKLDEYGKPTNEIKDEKRYHLLACLRYICSVFRPETQVQSGKNEIEVIIPRGW